MQLQMSSTFHCQLDVSQEANVADRYQSESDRMSGNIARLRYYYYNRHRRSTTL